MEVKLSSGKVVPIEMHKVKIVQKAFLVPIRERLRAITEAGFNTFLLRTRDVFIDMLTDSGTNAMSDNQLASMMVSDDAYAGGESYYRLLDAVKDVLGFEYCVPAHQGRAAEHLLTKIFVKPGDVVPMNYHFTTTKAHFEMGGAKVLELYGDDALQTTSSNPFKGNIDIEKLKAVIAEYGPRAHLLHPHGGHHEPHRRTAFFHGQPPRGARSWRLQHGIPVIIDCSLISENAYFIKRREANYADCSIRADRPRDDELRRPDLLSGRKSTCVRGGLIATNNPKYFESLKAWLPVYEGFITYGGMSSKEIEAMAVGLREMTDLEVASSSADLIAYFVGEMVKRGIPAVTPPGGLAGHVDAMKFIPHVPQSTYPAGALTAAIYLISGARGMERGSISMDRDAQGNDVPSDVELCRLAVPRRVYTVSHMDYVTDRVAWLLAHRDMIQGLRFIHEPPVLRFFTGRLEALNDWGTKLAAAYEADFGAEG